MADEGGSGLAHPCAPFGTDDIAVLADRSQRRAEIETELLRVRKNSKELLAGTDNASSRAEHDRLLKELAGISEKEPQWSAVAPDLAALGGASDTLRRTREDALAGAQQQWHAAQQELSESRISLQKADDELQTNRAQLEQCESQLRHLRDNGKADEQRRQELDDYAHKRDSALRRRFSATLRVGAFRWEVREDRTAYRAFLRAVQEQLSEYEMPSLSDLDRAFRMHYGSYGLVGYLCRVACGHSYIGPLSVVRLAGVPGADLERTDSYEPMSRLLRIQPEEWRAMCYRHVKGRNRHNQRLFCGQRISADDLNYGCPRPCPACLRERPIWWAVWDLGLVTACPIHGCLLLSRCPGCKRHLAWQRLAVHKCRCGLDFRDLVIDPADRDLVAINTAIYRAAGFPRGRAGELALADCGFPAELLALGLGHLRRLVLFVGSIKDRDRLRRKQQHFAATDLAVATEIGHAAATMLGDWPKSLRALLKHMLPPETDNPAALNFSAIFGNFYRHLFRVLPRGEFGFLHEAFERFVIEDWKGLIRGQHRYFSAAVRRNSRWVTAGEAEVTAHTAGGRIWDLARQGQFEAIFLNVRRTECWIRRESLNQWMAARDAELAPYMPRPEAKGALGLTNCTIVTVAAAGVIRYVKGPNHNFPARCFFFLREDVMKIKSAFEKHSVPVKAYSKPRQLIALRHAMKNYLGRDSGLAMVIRAVVDGSLVPVGYTTRFRGITGHLFLAEDLRKYRPVPGMTAPPEGVINYGEAAAVLGVAVPVIRGLVAQGLVHTTAEYRNGFSKLLPAADVQYFAESYVATSVLAKRFHLHSGSLACYLRESGTPLLAVPIPDAGKGHAYFLRKDLAAQIQLPSREMLREHARRRNETARKKEWAEYRLARETALGKPMRRVGARCQALG